MDGETSSSKPAELVTDASQINPQALLKSLKQLQATPGQILHE